MNLINLLNNKNVNIKNLTEDINKMVLNPIYSKARVHGCESNFAFNFMEENEKWLSKYSEFEKNNEYSKMEEITEERKERLLFIENIINTEFYFEISKSIFKEFLKSKNI